MTSLSCQQSSFEDNDDQEQQVFVNHDSEDVTMMNTSRKEAYHPSVGRYADNESCSSERGYPDMRHSDSDRGMQSQKSQRQQSGETELVCNEDFRAIRDRKLEVCREYIHSRCRRSEFDCRYAHPPAHIEVEEGFVTCCFDYSKGRCLRSRCRFMHPPPHLMPEGSRQSRHDMNFGRSLPPYLASALATYMSGAMGSRSGYTGSRNGRNIDKVEVCREFMSKRCEREQCRYAHPPPDVRCDNNHVTACMDFVNGNCARDTCRYFHPPPNILQHIRDMIETQGPPRKRPRSNDTEDARSDQCFSRNERSDGREFLEGAGDSKKFKSAPNYTAE